MWIENELHLEISTILSVSRLISNQNQIWKEYKGLFVQDDHDLPLSGSHYNCASSFSSLLLTFTPLLLNHHHLHGLVHRGGAQPELLLPALVPLLDLVLPLLLEASVLPEGRERDQPPHQPDRLPGLLPPSWQTGPLIRLTGFGQFWAEQVNWLESFFLHGASSSSCITSCSVNYILITALAVPFFLPLWIFLSPYPILLFAHFSTSLVEGINWITRSFVFHFYKVSNLSWS